MGIVIVLVLEKSFRLFKFLKKRIKPKFKKNKYQIFYETISTVLNLMERKKELAEAGVLVDLSFDAKTKEQITILALIRSGSLSFLGNDFKDLLLKIFDDDENKKDEIQHLCNYLENEQKKLMKLF
jgi:hypothetical protein